MDNTSLKRHFSDPQTISILIGCFAPFSPPTPQTKSSFETKTSAINVTPTSHSRFDIKQIKEDTTWLSKETQIDEVSALRIAVLEWQRRPAAQLLQGTGDTQTAYQPGGGGYAKLGASLFDPGSSILDKSTPADAETSPSFGDAGSRHRRLLETYLSERRCILKCSEFITSSIIRENEGQNSQGKQRSNWLKNIGRDILSAWLLDHSRSRKHIIVDAVDTLRSKCESLAKGSGWLQDEGPQEDVELAWIRSQILEMIHIMQITLNIIMSTSALLNSVTVLSWFRLMRELSFFKSVELVSCRYLMAEINGLTHGSILPIRLPLDLRLCPFPV